jgi:hypothetical protein
MPDELHFSKPYVTETLRIEGALASDWARALDSYRIQWTFEPKGFPEVSHKGRPCFHLVEMDMYLELIFWTQGPKGNPWTKIPERNPGTHFLRGYNQGEFRFQSSHPVSANLLMYCPYCSRFFFSFSLDTPCGFCGMPMPQVQEYNKLSTFGSLVSSEPQTRDLRTVMRHDAEVGAGRERSSLPMLPRANPSDLFDEVEAQKAKARESNAWDNLWNDLSGPAYSHKWPEVSRIEELCADYPNFSEVCQFLIREIRLSDHRPSRDVQLPNLLLVGGPSCGKSSFAERLSRILVDTDFTRIDLGQAVTNFALVGSDSGFKNGKEGRILRLMAGDATNKPVRNPVIILDELDKAFRDSTYNPLPALLALLEKRDAKRFVDEFFAAPIDASGINFLALANTLQAISGPLLSRFAVFQIEDYSKDQFSDVVIPAIYRDWCTRFFPGTFPQTLSNATRREISEDAEGVPRKVSMILDQLVFSDHPELQPVPTWESLRYCPTIETPNLDDRFPEEGGANHD